MSHDDIIKWKHFQRNWPFARGIHRSPVNSPHKGQWRGALMFTLICARINGWVNNCEAGDFRRNLAHYDVIVMRWYYTLFSNISSNIHPHGTDNYLTHVTVVWHCVDITKLIMLSNGKGKLRSKPLFWFLNNIIRKRLVDIPLITKWNAYHTTYGVLGFCSNVVWSARILKC